MQVHSALADITFNVGDLRLQNHELIVTSSADSGLDTTIVMTPHDLRRTMAACLKSRAFWRFLLIESWRRKTRAPAASEQWEARRRRVGLNKPW